MASVAAGVAVYSRVDPTGHVDTPDVGEMVEA